MQKLFIEDNFSKTFLEILQAFCTPNTFPKKLTLFSFHFNIWRCDVLQHLQSNFSFEKSFLESIRLMCFSVECVFNESATNPNNPKF